jgi:hypothetical protein
MAKKVYEMPDDHKRVVGNLLERLEIRDQLKKAIKDGNVKDPKMAVAMLADFEESLDKLEQTLADEYELYQKLQALKEEEAHRHEELFKMMEAITVDAENQGHELGKIFRAILDEADSDSDSV